MKEEKKDKDREGAICKVCSGDYTKNKDGQPEVLIHCAQCTSSGESTKSSALDMKLRDKQRTENSVMAAVYMLPLLAMLQILPYVRKFRNSYFSYYRRLLL